MIPVAACCVQIKAGVRLCASRHRRPWLHRRGPRPVLQAAGHEVVGLDAGWYDGCDFGPAVSARAADRRHSRRRAGRPRGLRRGGPSRRHLQRPDRPPEPRRHLRGQRRRRGVAAGRPRRPACRASCSPRPAPSTARRVTSRWTRTPVQPGDAVRREQGAGRARAVSARRRRLQPDLPAQRHGLRLVAAAAGRHRRQQPHRHRVHPRRGPAAERRPPWRPLVHVEDISAPSSPSSRRRARSSTTRRSTSAATRTSSRSGPSPTRSPSTRCPGDLRRGRRPRHARLPGRLHQDRRLLPAFGRSGPSPGHRGARAHMRPRSHGRGLRGPPLRPPGPIRELHGRRPARRRAADCTRREWHDERPTLPPLRRRAHRTFVDLGMSPPCESFLAADQLDQGETFYPLHVRICAECLLVQLPAYIAAEDIFSHYAYFSSFSDSWVAHARRFVEARGAARLGPESFVVEVASNDGYLLQHVVARGIRCLGIEPAANVAEAARQGHPDRGDVPRRGDGHEVAAATAGRPRRRQQRVRARARHRRLRQGPAGAGGRRRPGHHRDPAPAAADRGPRVRHDLPRALLLPVAAHDPAGAGRGRADRRRRRGAADPRRLAAHLVGAHRDAAEPSAEVAACWRRRPRRAPHARGARGLRAPVATVRNDLVEFLVELPAAGATVVAYGAPGKGNTLLNHCGIRADLLASRSTATRSSTASSCRARTSRSTRSRSWPRSTRLRRSSCRGTSARRSPRSSHHVRVGRRLVVPLPRLEVI